MNKPHLPPGQIARLTFPRFGLSQYANRFPSNIDQFQITIGGEIATSIDKESLHTLTRVTQVSDFHCVTTWTKTGIKWSGFRFRDFFHDLIVPHTNSPDELSFVVLKAQDGYKTSLPLDDLLNENVLLADMFDDQALGIAHGAPLRIVAPDHYGYKNLKHIKAIEFYCHPVKVKQGILSFMDHPRARVAQEERAVGGPGWFFRYIYRPLIPSTIKSFKQALDNFERENKSSTNP